MKSFRSRHSDTITTKYKRKYLASPIENIADSPLDLDFHSPSMKISTAKPTVNHLHNSYPSSPISLSSNQASVTQSSLSTPSKRSKSLSSKDIANQKNMINKPCQYQWTITGNEFEAIKKSKHEQGFESKEFKIIHNNHRIIKDIIWKLELYPNGYFGDDHNKCKLYLTSVSLPDNISKILACFTLYCVETQTRYVGTDNFTYNSCQCGWNDDMMQFMKIQLLS